MTEDTDKKSSKSSIWYQLIAGALFGFTAVYVGEDLITGGANGVSLFDVVSISQIAATGVAGLLLICLVIVAVGFGIPKAGIAMKMFEDLDEWQEERTKMWNSVAGGGTWAIMMIALAFAEELNLQGSVPALLVMGLLAGLVVFTSWRILAEYDELGHGLNSETYTVAMYITLAAGGAWSVAAQMAFVPALGPLDWITLLTAAIIVGAIWAAQRRGLLDD